MSHICSSAEPTGFHNDGSSCHEPVPDPLDVADVDPETLDAPLLAPLAVALEVADGAPPVPPTGAPGGVEHPSAAARPARPTAAACSAPSVDGLRARWGPRVMRARYHVAERAPLW